MTYRMRIGLLLILALLVVGDIGIARALVLDRGTITFDTATQRKWLDLSQSTGYSYNDLKGTFGCDPTCTSGPFAGFTFAQAGDVRRLIEDSGLPYGQELLFSEIPRAQIVLSLLGGQVFVDSQGCQLGCGGVTGILNRILTPSDLVGTMYNDPYYYNSVEQASLATITCCGDYWAGDNLIGPDIQSPYPVDPLPPSTGTTNFGDSFFTAGAWLYRVPEPPSLSLFVIGLVGLRHIVRRSARRAPKRAKRGRQLAVEQNLNRWETENRA